MRRLLRTRLSRPLRHVAMAVSGGATPRFQGGGPEITMTTTAAVLAGRVVEVSGDRSVRHAQNSSTKIVGVAKQAGSAIGDKIGVATSGVWDLTAKGIITAGDKLVASSANDGTVSSIGTYPLGTPDVTSTPTETTIELALAQEEALVLAIVGIALEDAADTESVPVLLMIG